MLNKELDEATCVAYPALSNDSAASAGKLADRQLASVPSATKSLTKSLMKSLNKQTSALNQHIFAGFTDNAGVILRASAGSMRDQTSQANRKRLNKFLQFEPADKTAVPDSSQPAMNRLEPTNKFRLGSATDQRPTDGSSQFDTDSDSVQLLDECNGSETDSDLQIVFPNHSKPNADSVHLNSTHLNSAHLKGAHLNSAHLNGVHLTSARSVKSEKSPNDAPLIDLASSSSDGSSNTDTHMNEDTDDSDRAASPKHTLDDHDLNSSANSSNFDPFSLNLPNDRETSDRGRRF